MKKILFFAFVLSVLISNTSQAAKKQPIKKRVVYENEYYVKVGETAPDFTMTLTNGKKIKLSSLRGKVVMLQFTASWCGVCRKEMPFIEKDIWQKHINNPNFALIALDREEPLEKIQELVLATGITYPIAFDPKGDIFGKYAVKTSGITRNVVIDKTGKIVKLTRLYNETEFSEMVNVIEKLLIENK